MEDKSELEDEAEAMLCRVVARVIDEGETFLRWAGVTKAGVDVGGEFVAGLR